jgi:hypothetical protein
MRTVVAFLVLAATSSPLSGAPNGQASSETRTYRHAYYLFQILRPVGCEDCYVPLLLTSIRLEDLAREKQGDTCIVITTYERDSIVGGPSGGCGSRQLM